MITKEIKQLYLNSNPDDEFYRAHDAIIEALDLDIKNKIPMGKVKEILMLLPDGDFCEGMQWSFGDTVVGDAVYTFILDNADTVRNLLNK